MTAAASATPAPEATADTPLRAAFPLAEAGFARATAFAGLTLAELEATLMAMSATELAEILYEQGDVDQFRLTYYVETFARVITAKFTQHGSTEFVEAVRAHERDGEAAKRRIGAVNAFFHTLVPPEQWRAEQQAARDAAQAATDQAMAAKAEWERRAEEIRPEMQAQVDARLAELHTQYAAAVATIEERHGAAALKARHKQHMEASAHRHRKRLDGILAFLRKQPGIGAQAVAVAMRAFDRQEAARMSGGR